MSRGLFLQAFLKTTDTILCSELEDISGGNSECETENLGSSPGFTAQRLFNIVLSDHLTEQFPEVQKKKMKIKIIYPIYILGDSNR